MNAIVKSFIKLFVPPRLVQFRSADGAVCLTFDDGPHENTEKLLEILNKHGVKATFFINGHNIPKFQGTLKKMVRDGHRIGNHFFDHVSARRISESEMRNQIETLEKEVERNVGAKVEVIRPPYGDWNVNLLKYSAATRKRIVMWSLDSLDGDAETRDARSIRKNMEAVRGGDIVLMHDDNAQTVAVLPEIIEMIRSKGLQFSQVGA